MSIEQQHPRIETALELVRVLVMAPGIRITNVEFPCKTYTRVRGCMLSDSSYFSVFVDEPGQFTISRRDRDTVFVASIGGVLNALSEGGPHERR